MKRLLVIPLVLVVGLATAQTVIVDDTLAPAPPAQYDNLTDAINSFQNSGANGGNVAANVILIQSFGPYDEVLPVIGSSGATQTSTFANDFPTTEVLTIQGNLVSTNWPLILARDTGLSGSSVILSGGTQVTLENLVIAQSPTLVGNDDFIFVTDDNSTLITNNVSITALPTTSTLFTESDLHTTYVDLVDGTRPYDPSLVRSGDNGAFIGLFNGTDACTWEMHNTVVTQQGAGASPDGCIPAGTSTLLVTDGSKWVHNARYQIQQNQSSTVIIQGTPAVPILFEGSQLAGQVGNNHFGGDSTVDWAIFRNLESAYVPRAGFHTFSNCVFENNVDHGILPVTTNGILVDNCEFLNNGGWGYRTLGATVTTMTLCLFEGNGGNSGTFPDPDNGAIRIQGTGAQYTIQSCEIVNNVGVGIQVFSDGANLKILDDTCLAYNGFGHLVDLSNFATDSTITNCTFYGSGDTFSIQYGASGDPASTPIVIRDSIIAGPGTTGIVFDDKGDSNITLQNVALVTDGTDALTATQSPATPVLNDADDVLADPIFMSVTVGNPNFLDVRNAYFGDKNSTGGPLVGCAAFIGDIAPPAAVPDWTIY